MARVLLRQLTKHYPPEKNGTPVPAVRGVDLEIRSGEFMVLVGPSGCGKSTTLRMVAGLEQISSGSIEIDGRIVNEIPPKDRDIAMVFQNYALYPHMSVRENMAFGLVLRKLARSEIDQRVAEAAGMLGLTELLDRKPRALSGGQRQRVAVGRAIVRKPKVFLFDEPLSNLDAKMRVGTRAEISRLHAKLGATMIYVTHDQVEAMTMGDRICVMQDGRIMQVATPLELYERPANVFVAGFIGSPPMNLVRGAIRTTDGRSVFTGPGRTLQIPLWRDSRAEHAFRDERPVVLGIRPEHIQVGETGIDALVELVEHMGAEVLVYLKVGGSTMIARLPPSDSYRRGDRVRVSVDPARVHLFDAATEQRLLWQGGS